MAPLSGEWLEALKGEFHQPYYAKLYKTVMQEYQTRKIFPPADDMFNAFHFTPLSQVKVVILGQDPYHNDVISRTMDIWKNGQSRACLC